MWQGSAISAQIKLYKVKLTRIVYSAPICLVFRALHAKEKNMIRIYGIRSKLNRIRSKLSDVINQCMVDALSFPDNKRAHRFIPMERENYYYPEGRTDAYTVIEISIMEGRSVEAKKKLIHLLFERIESEIGIEPVDVEITISESPACNWGFRGITGDEAKLNYKVSV